MAIRLGPPPGLARLRLRWNATRNQFQRQSRAWHEYVEERRVVTRLWWQQTAGKTLLRWNLRERARERQRVRCLTELDAFCEQYEELVDLLCWAAKEGAGPKQSAAYSELRDWMQTHYGVLRPRLRPFVHTPANVFDPFECLFAPQALDEVINDLTGIENVMLTRDALDAYRASLQSSTPATH